MNLELETEKRMQIENLQMEFQDIFTDVPRVCDLGEHEIKLTTSDPIRNRPYPILYAMREAFSKEIDTMLSLGIIEPSSSQYASAEVMARKSDDSIRVCCRLNRLSVFDAVFMPTVDGIFAQLSSCNYFSKFDLSIGYWQVPMKKSDKDFTAFTTHRGLFRFVVMPFGLVNASVTFIRTMCKRLYDIGDKPSYLPYYSSL
jgi:Reverse transcriptase (RNA-dependent DNA polymerase)